MRSLFLPLALMALTLSTSLAAQRTPGGGGTGGSGTGGAGGGRSGGGIPSPGSTSSTGFPDTGVPSLNHDNVIFFLSGKVVVDDGSALTDSATLQTNCQGQRRTIGITDVKGGFSVQLGGLQTQIYSQGDVTDSPSSTSPNTDLQGSRATDWHGCELQALAAGFTSQVVELGSRLNGDSVVDIGSIVLHRMVQVEGFTISATSAAAPRKARKDYEKGLSLEKKSAWTPAQRRFQSAVDLYPKYAAAWVELGRMQMKQDHVDDAQLSLQKAVAADSRFLPPYYLLIAIAATRGKWQDLADNTGQVLSLDPVSFPQYWFLNSAANYNLRKLDLAEKSAIRGLESDVQHRWPRLELVLGLTLARKHDYHGAVEHIRKFLTVAPGDVNAEVAQQQLKRLEALEHPSARAADPE